MVNESKLIGEYRGKVHNKVLIALLQSYLDVLDYDGLKSILREAELLELKNLDDINPNSHMDFFFFKKLIAAQNCLLYESNKVLYEIGKKFSFYLFPYGKKFEEIIEEINQLIETDWNIKIIKSKPKKFIISINKCIFCSEIGVPCDLIIGFLVSSLEKTIPPKTKVVYASSKKNINDPDHNTFILTLKIEKS